MTEITAAGWGNITGNEENVSAWVPTLLADLFFPGWEYVTLAGLVFVAGWMIYSRVSRSEGV